MLACLPNFKRPSWLSCYNFKLDWCTDYIRNLDSYCYGGASVSEEEEEPWLRAARAVRGHHGSPASSVVRGLRKGIRISLLSFAQVVSWLLGFGYMY